MKFFNPSDIFDNIIQTVQQMPVEAFYFRRQIRRVDNYTEKYRKKLKKAVKRLPNKNEEKINRIERKLTQAFSKKRELIERFREAIKSHMVFFRKLNELTNNTINVGEMALKVNCANVVKVSSQTDDDGIYCSCKSKAQGNMIMCANPYCEIRWYHFKCVGILKASKTQWKCSRCVAESG
ncbi:ING4 [Enterospora canceri]|uniref:ING4 n=1 Tax=Enterospora canceri TaxID=1081671 RepID=A0A1Y1S8G4_9MICR|nr:ING4 [Enterospora canceri]